MIGIGDRAHGIGERPGGLLGNGLARKWQSERADGANSRRALQQGASAYTKILPDSVGHSILPIICALTSYFVAQRIFLRKRKTR